ncbi:MAG: hypothetical protein ABJA94_04310 [Rhodoglobus sp.]
MSATPIPRFVLPGSWGRVDLSSEASSRRSIRKIAEAATNRRDDLAPMRADLRDRFQTAADLAREGGASDLYVAFELTKGVPLPAWLTVFQPDIESTDFAALGIKELSTVLDQAAKTPDERVTETRSELEDGAIHAVRQTWRRQTHASEGEGENHVEETFEILEADYWLAASNPNRIALMTFSTAYAEYEEEMLGLFDAVINTIRWPAPVPIEV